MTTTRRCPCGAQAVRRYCSDRCREREKKRRARRRGSVRRPRPRAEVLTDLDLFAAAGVAATRAERNAAIATATSAQNALSKVTREAAEELGALVDEIDAAHDDARALATELLKAHAALGWLQFPGPVRDLVEKYVDLSHLPIPAATRRAAR